MEMCRKFKKAKRNQNEVKTVNISLYMQDVEKVAKHVAWFFSGNNEENTNVRGLPPQQKEGIGGGKGRYSK